MQDKEQNIITDDRELNSLLAELRDPDPGIRTIAVKELAVKAQRKDSSLIRGLLNTETNVQIRYELQRIYNELTGKEATSLQENTRIKLKDALFSEDLDIVAKACNVILKKKMTNALPLLKKAARETENEDIHCAYYRILGYFGSKHLNEIIKGLSSNYPNVVITAIDVLSHSGSLSAFAQITPLLDSPHEEIAHAAISAIKQLGADRISWLVEKLASQQKEAWQMGALFLCENFSVSLKENTASLLKSSQYSDVRVRFFQYQDRKSKDSKPVSSKPSLDSENIYPWLKDRASAGKESDLDEILQCLRSSSNPRIIASSLSSLTLFSGYDAKREKAFKQYLDHRDDRVRANALEGLDGVFGGTRPEFFVPFLKDTNNRVTGNAIVAIEKSISGMTSAITAKVRSALFDLMQDQRENCNLTAVYCIGVLQNEFFLPHLKALLSARKPSVREKSLMVLQNWALVSEAAATTLKKHQEAEEAIEMRTIDEKKKAFSLDQKKVDRKQQFSFHQYARIRSAFEAEDPLIQLQRARSGNLALDRVVSLRENGEHARALKMVKEDTALPSDLKFYLLGRLHLELHEDRRASRYFKKSLDAGFNKAVILQEEYVLKFRTRMYAKAFLQWGSEQYTEKALFEIVGALVNRRRITSAVEFLEWMLLQYPDEKDTLIKMLARLRPACFTDIYYRYYGVGLLGLQLFASAIVLVISLWHLQYLGEPLWQLSKNIVTGVFPMAEIGVNLQKILPPVFLVVALAPVIWINTLMLFFRYSGKNLCFTEIYENYIKVCDFGWTYHLNFRNKEHELYLYQDDNDYTYNSLIRFLPFVPNLTYLYGRDCNRGYYCLVPIYGVADGSLFRQHYMHRAGGPVFSFNMFGVRLAQLATVLEKLKSAGIGYLIPVIPALLFLYANYKFALEASSTMYLIMTGGFLVSLIFYFKFTSVLRAVQNFSLSRFFCSVNIIRSGILFLAFWYFFGQYRGYGWLASVPVILWTWLFYLIFVLTKYSPPEKQIVAEVSAFGPMLAKAPQGLPLHHDLQRILLGRAVSIFPRVIPLYFNYHHVAIPVSFMGLSLYYEVFERQKDFEIQIKHKQGSRYSRVCVGSQKFLLFADALTLESNLKEQGLSVERVESLEPQPKLRAIPVFRVFAALCVLVLWHFQFGRHPLETEAQMSVKASSLDSLFFLKHEEVFINEKEGLRNRFENSMWSIKELDDATVFEQAEELTWQHLENAIQAMPETRKEQIRVPVFLKKSGFRDDVLSFLYWHGYQKWNAVNTSLYSGEYESYCAALGGYSHERAGGLFCRVKIPFNVAVSYVKEFHEFPEYFPSPLIEAVLSKDGSLLSYGNESVKNNRNYVLTAVKQDGNSLRFANPKLKSDQEVVQAAIAQNASAIVHAASEFRNSLQWRQLFSDSNFALKTVEAFPDSAAFLSETLLSNQRFAMECWQRRPESYQYFSEELKRDEGLLLKVLIKNPALWSYLDSRLKSNRLALNVFRHSEDLFQYLESSQLGDRAFLLQMLKLQPQNFIEIPEFFKTSLPFVLDAVRVNAFTVLYIALDWRFHADFCLLMVRSNPAVYPYLPESVKGDERVASEAIEHYMPAVAFLPESLLQNREFLLKAVWKNPKIITLLPARFLKDREFMVQAAVGNSSVLGVCPMDWHDSISFALEVVTRNGETLAYFSPEIQGEKQVILRAVKNKPEAFRHAAPQLRADGYFVVEAMKAAGVEGWRAFEYAASPLKEDRETVRFAVRQNGWAIKFAADYLKKDKEILKDALQQNGLALQLLSSDSKNNRELVITAVKQVGWALEYASSSLKQDVEILKTACDTTPLMKLCR